MKPRIKRRYGKWQCTGRVNGSDSYGYGQSPREAYWQWFFDGLRAIELIK